MAFKQVFYALREVFPQVDLRILKAVASQYSSDVDAAVEFVLSDVLPAVSEPTEAHYTLQDISNATNVHSDSWNNCNFHERNLCPSYHGPLCTKNTFQECSCVEDKVVINETIVTPTGDYIQFGESSTSATKPPIVDHCAMEKGKLTPEAESFANQNNFNSNLPDLLVSSQSKLPLYIESPPECAVTHKGQTPLKIFEVENTQNFTESEHNHYLQVLLEKEMPLKLSEDETVCHFSKSEDNYNLDTLFVEFHSNEDTKTSHISPSVPTVQTFFEDSFDLQALYEKGVPLKLSTSQSINDFSKSQDNCNLQVLFENIDNVGKELDMLNTAENNPELHKSEDGLHLKPCSVDSTIQVPRFLVKDENQQSSYKLEDQCILFDLFARSKFFNNSSRILEEKDNSYTVVSKKKPSMEYTNSPMFTSICNMNDDFNLPELFSSPNFSLSNLDSKCEVRDGAEKEIRCSDSADKHSFLPVIVHDTNPHNEMKLIPAAYEYEEFLDITLQSYQIAEINKLVSDITNGKEALSYLYDSTTIKMKEVELQEESSRKAKQDAVKSHQGFAVMVENFNHLIENSKRSNDKEAQIVRQEKSLLVALAQDLHFRLTKLSTERDEALAIVEEIKFELEARLATSIEEETAAREQIIQEENLALSVRKEKEAKLGSIVEESRKLQKEAEENILLGSLLSDCRRTIDILQGEISSIHEKVIALKEGTNRSKLQSALVTTSSSATSSPVSDCKTAPANRHQQLKNGSNSNLLPQEKMVGSHSKDHEFSDNEWEILETTQAYN